MHVQTIVDVKCAAKKTSRHSKRKIKEVRHTLVKKKSKTKAISSRWISELMIRRHLEIRSSRVA